MDVFFYEAFEEEVAALRRRLPLSVRADFTWKTIQEAGDTEPPAPLVSIRTQSVIPAAWTGKVRGIVSRTTGFDHLVGIQLPYGYLPHYCSRAVAEQAILLVMALLRKLPQQTGQFPRFYRDGLTGRECTGKKLLVVGVGEIGSEIVKIGIGLGMDVRGVDILQKYPYVTYSSIEEGLAWADVIVCAMNLTKENGGCFNYKVLKQARRGVVFVNVARGELSPTNDLLKLLDEGHVSALALDVYENESKLAVALRSGKSGFPLLGRPNVILTPHNAFNTAEAVERKAEQTIRQIEHFLKNGEFLWQGP
ncbi:MAG TPA: 2-hydroxyacid dehydrogenase [Verrucomicrobiae bacterium]|nr:2-hydroxyacid dehydrogenase [Verrucomicrobiae bacterium]